jgi:hypothetical protein
MEAAPIGTPEAELLQLAGESAALVGNNSGK